MAYFPNGTAGMYYEEQYCSRCVHFRGPDGDSGCAVWLLHLLFNYEQVNDDDHPIRVMLNTLIPETEDKLGAEQCALFYPSDPDEQADLARGWDAKAREGRDRQRYQAALAEMRAQAA
jgi:hypothetical protein